MLGPVRSVTHAHLVHAAASELRVRRTTGRVNLLDVGCGDGHLLLALHHHLAEMIGLSVELQGFDVSDARIQPSKFFESAAGMLLSNAPEVDWQRRLSLIRSTDAWPFGDASMDIVLSNQVLEHVLDVDHFMDELRRVLRPDGVCINLFPVRSQFVETHVGAPLAHRLSSDDVRKSYLGALARLGLSRFGPMRITANLGHLDFASTRSEYVATQTWYRSFPELATSAHRHQLSASHRWTPEFYALKLGYITGRDFSAVYDQRGSARVLLDWLLFPILSRVSCITLVLEKGARYSPDACGAFV